jgi:hypothetical protein
MEFKGTQENWSLSENIKEKSNGFMTINIGYDYNCTYYGKHKQFEDDFCDETKANALLISKVPELLDELNETVTDLKILKGNILDALKTNNLFQGMPEIVQKWIDRKELLIKQATEL